LASRLRTIHAEVKLINITPNIPMPRPSRGAVPVNQGYGLAGLLQPSTFGSLSASDAASTAMSEDIEAGLLWPDNEPFVGHWFQGKKNRRAVTAGNCMAVAKTSSIYGSWLPFLRDFFAAAKPSRLGSARGEVTRLFVTGQIETLRYLI
jgi:hypothetical protein